MRILLACEESQAVTIALRNRGHEAFSCDILPCSGGHPEWHIQGFLEDIVGDGSEWDMVIAFPPCTYMASSGLFRNINNNARAEKTEYALAFVCMIMNLKCPRIAIENPVGCISTRIGWNGEKWQVYHKAVKHSGCKPAQIIQPHEFGNDASKTTCLWLFGLPKLKPTKHVAPRIVNGKKRWANQTDDGQNKIVVDGKWIGYNDKRTATLRSKTYSGIAEAMAEQWTQPDEQSKLF